MPIRDILVDQASSSIIEPISHQMTNIVLSQLGLTGAFDNNVYITNDYIKSSLTSDDDHNALISKDRCDVKVNTNWNPTELKWDVNKFTFTQAYGRSTWLDKELIPVFYDKTADVRLTEHLVPCTMTLDFSLQFKNREFAIMAISTINNTSAKDSVVNYHNLSYYYPIGNDIFASLNQIYQLRKKSLNPLNFSQYLALGSRSAITFVQQRTGPKFEIVIKRQVLRSLGVLEYTETGPQVMPQERGVDRFAVNFTYTLQFSRPDVLRLYFPVVVYNQVVPYNLLRSQQQADLPTLYGQFQEKSITRMLRETSTNLQYTVRLPQYDDFRPPMLPAKQLGFAEFFDSVLLLDNANTTTVDLQNIGFDIQINPTAIAIMKLHGNEIFGTNGIFNISVYQNDIPVDCSCLSIDSNLVVTVSMSDQSKRYHIVISEATKLQNMHQKWLTTILEYRTFFPITVIMNLQILIDRGYCYLDRNNILLQVINAQIRNFNIDNQIAALITAGHINHYAYCYATTAEQWAGFIMHAHSALNGQLVYDAYTALCISQGLLTQAELGSGYVRTKDGYPFLPRNVRGPISSINMPLRIEMIKLKLHGSDWVHQHPNLVDQGVDLSGTTR